MQERPNILFIIAHDLGTRLGCYGEHSVQTPALDGLAAAGARFENHFCTAPFCSPSRGAIFTGCYPHTNGLMGLVNLGWDLPTGSITLADRLARAGYDTLLFGLQHEARDPARLGYHYVSDRAGGTRCAQVAPEVADFLRGRERTGDRPFLACVGFSEVHRPWERYSPDGPAAVAVPPYLRDTPGCRQDLAAFHGAIRQMDDSVGRILDALAETGLEEDTLTVFTTDHGPAFPRAKATLYDPGLRTALLLRWPAAIAPGTVVGELVSNVDLLPSLMEAVGQSAPDEVQGRSFWARLRGEAYTPRECVFAEKNTQPDDTKRCIRTRRHKYIRNYDEGPLLRLPTDIESGPTRRDMGDAHLAPRPPVELYDLEADPWEQRSMAGSPEAAAVERELSGRLDRFLAETDDPILRGPIPRPPEEAELLARAWSRVQRHP